MANVTSEPKHLTKVFFVPSLSSYHKKVMVALGIFWINPHLLNRYQIPNFPVAPSTSSQ